MTTVSGYWLLATILIFGSILLYFTLTPAFEEVYITVYNATTRGEAQTTENFMMFIWNAWCPIVIIGAIVMAMVASQKRDEAEIYY